MRNRTLLTLSFVGLHASSAFLVSAQSDAPFGEVVDVHLVTVEVAVETYLSLEPIADLTRENFSIFEDGEPRTITHFERIRGGVVDLSQGPTGEVFASPSVGGPAVVEAPPRHVALAFDFGTLRRPYLERTVKAAKKFVRSDPDPRVEYSVMVLGRRPDVLLPFTTGRDRVEMALDSLGALLNGNLKPANGLAFGAPERFIRPQSRKVSAMRRQGEVGNYLEASAWQDSMSQSADFLELADRFGCHWRELAFSDVLAEAFQGWPGGAASKSMVLFYEPAPCKLESMEGGALGSRYELGEAFDATARLAVASGIKVYATQSTGLANPVAREASERGSIPSTGASPSAYLADMSREASVDQVTDRTGGRHLDVNDLSRGLEMAATTSSNHYRLSFQVSRAPDGETHSIDINVDLPGKVTVRFPRSYEDVDGRTRLERQLRTSANIPKRGGSLPVAVAVQVDSTDEDMLPVLARITVPVEELGLRWTPDEERPEVDLFVAVYDENGDFLEMKTEPWTRGTLGEEGSLVQEFTMELPVGAYTLSLAALDMVTGRYGLDFAEVHP